MEMIILYYILYYKWQWYINVNVPSPLFIDMNRHPRLLAAHRFSVCFPASRITSCLCIWCSFDRRGIVKPQYTEEDACIPRMQLSVQRFVRKATKTGESFRSGTRCLSSKTKSSLSPAFPSSFLMYETIHRDRERNKSIGILQLFERAEIF